MLRSNWKEREADARNREKSAKVENYEKGGIKRIRTEKDGKRTKECEIAREIEKARERERGR